MTQKDPAEATAPTKGPIVQIFKVNGVEGGIYQSQTLALSSDACQMPLGRRCVWGLSFTIDLIKPDNFIRESPRRPSLLFPGADGEDGELDIRDRLAIGLQEA